MNIISETSHRKNELVTKTSLIAITFFTIIELYYKQTSVFYILYLFWFDEFIKTISNWITYYFKKKKIENQARFVENIKTRFFMLFGYFLFIVILFGLVMNRNDFNLIGINLTVLAFQNTFFNLSIAAFVVREIYLYCNNAQDDEAFYTVSNGIIILHLSIILGVFIWFLSTRKFQIPVEYVNIFSIIPFLLLKLLFEIKLKE